MEKPSFNNEEEVMPPGINAEPVHPAEPAEDMTQPATRGSEVLQSEPPFGAPAPPTASFPEIPTEPIEEQAVFSGSNPNALSFDSLRQTPPPPQPSMAEKLSPPPPSMTEKLSSPPPSFTPSPTFSEPTKVETPPPAPRLVEEERSQLPLVLSIAGLVLGFFALLIAVGIIPIGPSSSEIGADRILPGAIGEEQLASDAVSLEKISPALVDDLRGDEGPKGAPGPEGPVGPAGTGLGSLSLESKQIDGSNSSEISRTVACSAESVLVSGGASLSGAEGAVVITSSGPTSDGSAWKASAARIVRTGSKASWKLTVYAWCGKKTKPKKETGTSTTSG